MALQFLLHNGRAATETPDNGIRADGHVTCVSGTHDSSRTSPTDKTFALAIIKFCRTLPKADEARVIRWQLLRCGPAVGASRRLVL